MAQEVSQQVSEGHQLVGWLFSISKDFSWELVRVHLPLPTLRVIADRSKIDPRDTNLIFEQMYRGSMFYGRKGLPLAVISVIDLAIWDLLGKIRNEPVYKMIGGNTKGERLDFYCTG